MPGAQPVITLTTDFGTSDGYVGAMVGVIATRCPGARIEHITHGIAAQDVAGGAAALANAAPYFPAGTIHVAVIDPGVGTSRRAVAVAAGGHVLVGPDNGVLMEAAERLGGATAARLLEHPGARLAVVSSTFHGRDLFAPAAAALGSGWALESLGAAVEVGALAAAPSLPWGEVAAGVWSGCVARVDRFGNLITNLPASVCAAGAVRLTFAGRPEVAALEGPRATYGEVPEGEALLLVDSTGRLEVAVRGGSAAARLGVGRGAGVRVERLE